jgi:hypothetical protein
MVNHSKPDSKAAHSKAGSFAWLGFLFPVASGLIAISYFLTAGDDPNPSRNSDDGYGHAIVLETFADAVSALYIILGGAAAGFVLSAYNARKHGLKIDTVLPLVFNAIIILGLSAMR